MRSTSTGRLVAAACLAAALAACGGGSGSEPASWGPASKAATVPSGAFPTSMQTDPAGGLSVGWTSYVLPIRNGWLHRAAAGTAWTAAPELPVEFRIGTTLVGWFTDANGVRAALVHDDGYRTDESGLIDIDPRPAFTQSFERTASGWAAGPEILLPEGSSASGWCANTAPQTGEGFCLLPHRVNTNGETAAEYRFRPGQGWSGPSLLDAGGTQAPVLAYGVVAAAASGRALATWVWHPHGISTPSSTGYHTYEPASGWSAIGSLADAHPWPFSMTAVPTGSGYLTAYQDCDASRCRIVAARHTNGAWEAPLALTPDIPYTSQSVAGFLLRTPEVRGPAIAAGDAGHAVVFWRVADALWMRHYAPGSGWSPASLAPEVGELLYEPRAIRVESSGRVTVATRTALAQYMPGLGWTSLKPVPWPDSALPIIGVDAQGRITAVWRMPQVTDGVETAVDFHTATVR
jgi:hypothetical protein